MNLGLYQLTKDLSQNQAHPMFETQMKLDGDRYGYDCTCPFSIQHKNALQKELSSVKENTRVHTSNSNHFLINKFRMDKKIQF